MTLPRYEQYKDSGIEWIGYIPEHWKLRSFRYAARICNGSEYKDIEIDDGGYPVLGSGGEFARASSYIYNKPSVLLGRKGTIDKPLYIETPFWAIDTMFYTTISHDTHPKFLYWFCNTIPFILFQHSTALPSMTQNDLHSLPIPFLPISEQAAIASFLDDVTAKIDALIAEKQCFIDLLKEKRQTTIFHAVTKGLNSNVLMKDSEVEWLGKVPQHWIVASLKHNFQIIGGSTPKSDEEPFWDGDIIWVTPADLSNLKSLYLNNSSKKITTAGMESCGTTLIPPDSIILSTRAPVGSLAITEIKCCTNQGCKSLVPIGQKITKFYGYLLGTVSKELNIRANGTTFLELSGDELGIFKVPVPPLDEQISIVSFLDHETAKIDVLIGETYKAISLLQDRRTALISAAVTGKIDIRHLANQEAS